MVTAFKILYSWYICKSLQRSSKARILLFPAFFSALFFLILSLRFLNRVRTSHRETKYIRWCLKTLSLCTWYSNGIFDTVIQSSSYFPLLRVQSQHPGALQAGGAGLAGFRCGTQVSEQHCALVAHKKVVVSLSWESFTCRENCWSFLLSLAVNLPLIFSFSLENNCIREWRPSLGSCVNHWKKSAALSL